MWKTSDPQSCSQSTLSSPHILFPTLFCGRRPGGKKTKNWAFQSCPCSRLPPWPRQPPDSVILTRFSSFLPLPRSLIRVTCLFSQTSLEFSQIVSDFLLSPWSFCYRAIELINNKTIELFPVQLPQSHNIWMVWYESHSIPHLEEPENQMTCLHSGSLNMCTRKS